ncbi:serine protease [Penaeus vannamei]|uniref:Serine protease n=1 Tax=Penaeus vannamei TaxID=6689 RepID=A0A3R7QS92_PENVA|nr:serine protease [Penaeus vannamei]
MADLFFFEGRRSLPPFLLPPFFFRISSSLLIFLLLLLSLSPSPPPSFLLLVSLSPSLLSSPLTSLILSLLLAPHSPRSSAQSSFCWRHIRSLYCRPTRLIRGPRPPPRYLPASAPKTLIRFCFLRRGFDPPTAFSIPFHSSGTHVRLGNPHSARTNDPSLPLELAIADFVDAGYDLKNLGNDLGLSKGTLLTFSSSSHTHISSSKFKDRCRLNINHQFCSLTDLFNHFGTQIIFQIDPHNVNQAVHLIRPVCLPYRFMYDGFRYQEVDVTGWSQSATSLRGAAEPAQLVLSRAAVVGLGVCENTFQKEVESLALNNQQMCAVVAEDQPCLNDNGAPVTFLDDVTTNRHFLVGLTSFGYGCEKPFLPGVYVRVGAFLDWIEKNING